MEIQICRSIKKTIRDVWNLLLLAFIDDFIPREPLHLLKQIVKMQTEVRVNYLNCHIHVPSKHVLANREANSRHTFDVAIWLSRTTDNSNIFIRSREVRDNESRLYILLVFDVLSILMKIRLWCTHYWHSYSPYLCWTCTCRLMSLFCTKKIYVHSDGMEVAGMARNALPGCDSFGFSIHHLSELRFVVLTVRPPSKTYKTYNNL